MKIDKTMPEINIFIRWFGLNFSTYYSEKDKQTHYVIWKNNSINWIKDIYQHIEYKLKRINDW